MRMKALNHKIVWTLLFFLLILIELVDIIASFFFPSIKIFRVTAVILLMATIPYFLFTVKRMSLKNQEYEQNKTKLNNIFDTLDVAIWSHDLKTDELLITPGIEKLYGYSLEDFYQDPLLWKKVIYAEDLPVIAEREEKTAMGESVTSEYRIIRPNGDVRWILDRGFPIVDEKGSLVYFSSVLFDITDRKKVETTIKTMAYYDSLTGLPNRNKFRQHLDTLLNNNRTKLLAVLFLDVDRFKIINDTKGHSVGDLVLQEVAKRLEAAVQKAGLVSRQGGDEFLIVLEGTDREKAAVIAGRILQEFVQPLYVETLEFFVTPSIGISLYPDHGLDEETLIKNADTAMYKAKERGNQVVFYSSTLNGISVRKMELENGLRKAIEKNQLQLFYQPQVSLATGQIVGAEALIRWQHPDHGFIPPCEFIPLAEETGLIVPIGKWILIEACKQKKAWEQNGISGFPIAVNVSVRQFEDEQFIEHVAEVLEETGLESGHLELEITESITQNLELSSKTLKQLKDMGVILAIDDFGTGYSSLSYLKHLPIDKIKIDKSFVDDIRQATTYRSMVKTIIDMGLNLDFTVIAEGIETEEQLRFLQKNDCHIGQGYYFSKPLPAEQVKELLLKGNGKLVDL
ncbi:putative bifunctional diguanylate cyclase/phosphodiesterase [Neobacillus kokaensis]|uniref:Histidine kinase n=1 Tax=Neobacillus kokaensis TaxID=2759023 RepID=A0ABQ3N6Y6_9BACI|nr:GGDEF domain-containing phosphodiesterase [Neobacillus kokaensis]GHI00704.1 hypothetical protein AM1BK_42460 [Neobacillus kokaensis]